MDILEILVHNFSQHFDISYFDINLKTFIFLRVTFCSWKKFFFSFRIFHFNEKNHKSNKKLKRYFFSFSVPLLLVFHSISAIKRRIRNLFAIFCWRFFIYQWIIVSKTFEGFYISLSLSVNDLLLWIEWRRTKISVSFVIDLSYSHYFHPTAVSKENIWNFQKFSHSFSMIKID